jgi:hypothetical protein
MWGYELPYSVSESKVIPGFGVTGAKSSVYVSREWEKQFSTRDPTIRYSSCRRPRSKRFMHRLNELILLAVLSESGSVSNYYQWHRTSIKWYNASNRHKWSHFRVSRCSRHHSCFVCGRFLVRTTARNMLLKHILFVVVFPFLYE